MSITEKESGAEIALVTVGRVTDRGYEEALQNSCGGGENRAEAASDGRSTCSSAFGAQPEALASDL